MGSDVSLSVNAIVFSVQVLTEIRQRGVSTMEKPSQIHSTAVERICTVSNRLSTDAYL